MDSNEDRRMFVRVLLLVGLGVLAAMVMGSAGATITGDAPPATGDWVVNSATTVTSETVYVDGNLTVNGNLVVRDSTLVMNVSFPWQYSIHVTSTGLMTATDTTFASNDSVAGYGFYVRGQVDLLRCRVTQTEDGLRILTGGAQSIASTTIDDFHLCGLYLEDADSTTVTDVTVQSDRFETFRTYDFTVRESGQREHFVVPVTSAFQVKGGNPSVDGLTISVNGSFLVTGEVHFYPDKASNNLILLFPCVALMESDQVLDLAHVVVRDCALAVHGMWDITEHTTLAAGKHTINHQYYLSPILLHNSAGARFSYATVRDARLGDTSNQYSTTGSGINANEVNQGTWAILALTDEVIADTDERAITMEVVDSTFLRLGALYVYIAPIGTDENLTRVALDLNVDSVRVEECPIAGAVQVENTPIFQKDLVGRFEIALTDSTFTANSNTILSVGLTGTARPYRGQYPASPSTAWANIYDNITVTGNHIYDNYGGGINIGTGGSGRTADAALKDEASVKVNANLYEYVYIEDNTFEGSDGTQAPVTVTGQHNPHKGLESIFLRRNVFRECITTTTGATNLIQLTGKDYVRVDNNTFTDNLKSCAIKVITNGGDADAAEPADVVIADNTFVRNRFWHNNENNMGMMIIKIGGDVTITRNSVTADESRAFVNIMEYPRFAGYANYLITDNELTDSPGMTGIIYMRYFDVYHSLLYVLLEDNLVRDCGVAPLMDYYDFGPDLDTYDYDARVVVRDNTVINATEEVIRAHGEVSIVSNTFTDCRGYVVNLQYLNEHLPVISDNVFTDCHHLIYLGSKAKCIGGLALVMEDLDMDCTGNALRFYNMQAVLENVVVSYTADPAIIAENSVVSIVGGDIKEGSGRMIGLGSITRYHVLEAHVTWQNATITGSGVPAADVPVMLLDSEGRLAMTRRTDEEGSLGSVLVPAWTVRSMFVTRHTPHTLLIGTSGIARSLDVIFDRDYVGEDALEIQLVDDRVPVVAITSPVSGQNFRSDAVTVTGFVLEMGSGIDWIRITVNDGSPVEVTTDRGGTFSQEVTGLDEGEIKLTLAARDVAGNLQSRDIHIRIDRTPPQIVIVEPWPGLITPRSSVHLSVLLETDTTLYINGRPQDVSDGQLDTDWPLTEGENVLLLKAVDAAGNTATETITVTRDSAVPLLLLLGPQDSLLTSDPTVEVWGETEPGIEVWLLVLDGTTELQNVSIEVGPDGTFSGTVDLDEGAFDLVVTARDRAMNVATARVTVSVDITPPSVAITSPADGTLFRGGTVQVRATVDAGALVFVNGVLVDNDGGIVHTLQLVEGSSTVEVRAVDGAGNTATSSVTVTVDSVAPVVELTSPLSDHVTIATRTLTVSGRVTGDPASLTVMGEEVPLTDGMFSKELTLADEGVIRIPVRATDAAGNLHEVVLTVDAAWTPPILAVDVGKTLEDGKVMLECTVTGDCVGLLVTRTSASGEASRTVLVEDDGTYKVVCDLEKGDNTIVVRAIDAHGGYTESAPVSEEYSPEAAEEEEGAWGALEAGVILLALGLAMVLTVLALGLYLGRRQG